MVQLFKDTFQQWQKDDAATLAAALAYYAIFALGPLFTVLLGLVSVFVDQETAASGLMQQVRSSLGPGAADLLQQTMTNGGGQTLLGGVILVFSASGLFAHLQKALNIIWNVQTDPDSTWKDKLGQRLLSILMVLGGGLLLTVSLLASAVLSAWKGNMANFFLPLLNELLTLVMTVVLFAVLFKVLPDTSVAWKDVGVGACLTGCLFTLGKALMGLYLGSSEQQFGGSLILLLVWIYYSAQILFLGAEFTQVYSQQNKDGSAETLPS